MHKFSRVLAGAALSVGLVACSGGGPPKLLVVTPDAAQVGSSDQSGGNADANCAPLDETSTSDVHSSLKLSGACSFTDHNPGKCVLRPGDLYLYIHHDLPGNGTMVLTLNVENYSGPREYLDKAQVYVQVTRAGQFYYWSTNKATVAIDQDQMHMTVKSAALMPQAGTPAKGTMHVSGTGACPSLVS